jgi:phosphoribosylaminoimidazole-succinocarboxamide synthase
MPLAMAGQRPDQLPEPLLATNLPLAGRRQGKVRDLYDLPPAGPGQPARVLIIATDRISAFDVVMPTPIPGKGRILTQISTRWFEMIERAGLCETHTLSTNASDIPGLTEAQRAPLVGRIVIAQRCRVIPVECVVRGYLAGSGWVEYQAGGAVCGVPLPPGLRNGDRLPEPIFTPATKAELGAHDENIDFDRACDIAGAETMTQLRDISIAIYKMAHEHARKRGVVLADTKFEFGFTEGELGHERLLLVDEALTPDSSRFWPGDAWSPGREQESFDKQFVRNYLLGLVRDGHWKKQAPGPVLPDEIVERTLERYQTAAHLLFDVPMNLQASVEAGR